jgi:putative DNA primase/helicase
MSDLIVSAGPPAKTAKLFKAARRPNLVNQQGEWLDWNGAAYQPIEAATIRAEVSAYLETAKTMKSVDGRKMKAFPFDPEPKHIVAVVTMLETLCHAPKDTMAPPCWLPGTPNELLALDPVSLISCQNGLLDPATRTLYDATPFFFTRNALSLEFDELAPAPTQWLEFLNETLQGRAPLIELVQEMMGYVISSDTSMQKVFFMFGRPRSGKGTILRVTTALVGAGNTTFPTIETLGGQYGLQGLIGKSLAQITDMNTDSREKLGVAASRINGISGEDGQTIERKYMTPYDGKLGTRFVMAGNTMPNLGSHTLAMAPRLLIVPFEVSFAGREDRELTDKLMLEHVPVIFTRIPHAENN